MRRTAPRPSVCDRGWDHASTKSQLVNVINSSQARQTSQRHQVIRLGKLVKVINRSHARLDLPAPPREYCRLDFPPTVDRCVLSDVKPDISYAPGPGILAASRWTCSSDERAFEVLEGAGGAASRRDGVWQAVVRAASRGIGVGKPWSGLGEEMGWVVARTSARARVKARVRTRVELEGRELRAHG